VQDIGPLDVRDYLEAAKVTGFKLFPKYLASQSSGI
jgi:hypothetical protein